MAQLALCDCNRKGKICRQDCWILQDSHTGLCFLLAINLIETVEWDVSQDRVEISLWPGAVDD